MLPTFSLNTEPQKKFTEIVYNLIKGKENISGEELSNIAEYAYKKAYDKINCTYKTFKYNLKWEGNQGVYKSDKQRNYMRYIEGRSKLSCTIFVPSDCNNHCKFCTSKQMYKQRTCDMDAIIAQIKKINENPLIQE